MPLPERLQPAKVNRQKLKQLADMAEEILAQIDNGAKEEDAGLKMLINDWNSQVINPYAFSDFRDFSSWTSAKDFTRMAFNQEKYVADLSWDELIQIIQFVCQAEGKESEQSYARKRPTRTVLTGMCYSVGSATRQGSSSLTRLTGQSAMTSRTWLR